MHQERNRCKFFRKGTDVNSEAIWVGKISSPDSLKIFHEYSIHLQKEMNNKKKKFFPSTPIYNLEKSAKMIQNHILFVFFFFSSVVIIFYLNVLFA